MFRKLDTWFSNDRFFFWFLVGGIIGQVVISCAMYELR